MTYARIENGAVVEYPVFPGDIQLRYPNVSFPTPFIPPDGYELVADLPIPEIAYTQNVKEGTPVFVKGVLTRNWVVSDATPEQITERVAVMAAAVRAERNRRLSGSDWTQIPDAAQSAVDVPAWTEYRKQLRSVPEQPGFPWDVQWPAEPPAPEGPILDYGAFFNMLVGSSVYAAIRAKAATDTSVLIPCIELLNALGDARNGRPNPALIQAGLSALVTAANFSSEETAAFQALLDGLGFSAVYSLS